MWTKAAPSRPSISVACWSARPRRSSNVPGWTDTSCSRRPRSNAPGRERTRPRASWLAVANASFQASLGSCASEPTTSSAPSPSPRRAPATNRTPSMVPATSSTSTPPPPSRSTRPWMVLGSSPQEPTADARWSAPAASAVNRSAAGTPRWYVIRRSPASTGVWVWGASSSGGSPVGSGEARGTGLRRLFIGIGRCISGRNTSSSGNASAPGRESVRRSLVSLHEPQRATERGRVWRPPGPSTRTK